MFLGRSAQQHPLLPSVSRIRSLHMPGANLPAPVRNHAAASAVRALRSRSSNFPSSFSKQSPATARALLFSCPSLRVCSDAPVHFFAQAAQYISLFSPLPPCVARLPAVQRDVSQKKPPDNSEKRGAIGENTGAFPAYSAVSRFCRHRRSAHPRVFTELPDARKHRVPIYA